MSQRGPKPKPHGKCPSCGFFGKLKRGHCSTCYSRKLRKGELEKLAKKECPLCFNDLQHQYLIGSLLGDGCVYRRKETHLPYFASQRTFSDKAYSLWEKTLLAEYVCKWYDGSSFDRRTNKEYYWTKLRTHRCEALVSYYTNWYGGEKKQVPQNIQLSPLSLAVWFADDGYVREINDGRLQLKLSTHGFDLESVEFLCESLSTRYSEYFGITLENGTQPVIYASDVSTRAFTTEIDSVLPVAMNRKALWRKVAMKFPAKNKAIHLRKTQNGKRIQESQVP